MSVLATVALLAAAPSPFATIKEFIHALKVNDSAMVIRLTLGGRMSNLDRVRDGAIWDVTTSDPKVTRIGYSAVVTAKFKFNRPNDVYTKEERTTLKLVGGAWRVIPASHYGYASFISNEASSATDDWAIRPHLPFRGSQRLAQARVFASTLETYLIDHDFRIKFTEGRTRATLRPLLDHRDSLLSPFTGKAGFHVNFQLSGKRVTDTLAPGITIMVYEGSHGKLDFSHGGKAAVGFVDGHVELVSQKDMKSLLWK